MMIRCSVEPEIFDAFPDFCRGVVVAKGFDNSRPDPRIAALLRQEEARVRAELGSAEGVPPRLAAWNEAYRRFGANPAEHTPSLVYLVERLKSGKQLASISPAVDLFNYISLRYLVPAGGDDLDTVVGDLTLGFASGEETFAPLFRPTRSERPEPGEVIYVNRRQGRVLCRRWNWRNADFSKITPESRSLVINVDGLTSVVERAEIEAAAQELARLLLRFGHGLVSTYVLDHRDNEIEVLSAAA